MQTLNIDIEEKRLKKEIKSFFENVSKLTDNLPEGFKEQVAQLFLLRNKIYEDLNQIQHQSLIIEAAKFLQNKNPINIEWKWHPRQTSHPDEPDLIGSNKKCIIYYAEITTSNKPIGTIDSRMDFYFAKIK